MPMDSEQRIHAASAQGAESGLLLSWSLRLALFVLLLAAELIPASARFTLHRGGGTILQIAVVSISLFLAICSVRSRDAVRKFAAEVVEHPVAWRFLVGNALAYAAFIELSFLSERGQSGGINLIVAGLWWISAAAAILAAVHAFFPLRSVHRFLKSGGRSWIHCLIAGLLARSLVSYTTFWNGAVWNPAFDLSWKPATDLTFRTVQLMLSALLPTVMADPSEMIIGTPAFQVKILAWCAGFEGMALILVFTTAWLGFFRHEYRFPHALLLVPCGVIVMWISNAIRITVLVLIGVAGAPHVAVGGFHSQAGWIAFTLVAVTFLIVSQRMSWFLATGAGMPVDVAPHNPAAPYLMPFAVILGAGMISSAASSTFEWLYPLRFVAAGIVLWIYRRAYRSMDWRWDSVSIVAGAVVIGIWILLSPDPGPVAGAGIAEGLASLPMPARVAWLIGRVAAAVLTVPIAEELAFRGFLIRRMISADFERLNPRAYTPAAVLVSSVLFGVLHGGQWLAGILAGVIFAGVYLRKGRLGDAVVAHATANGLLAGWVLMGGRWYLW